FFSAHRSRVRRLLCLLRLRLTKRIRLSILTIDVRLLTSTRSVDPSFRRRNRLPSDLLESTIQKLLRHDSLNELDTTSAIVLDQTEKKIAVICRIDELIKNFRRLMEVK